MTVRHKIPPTSPKERFVIQWRLRRTSAIRDFSRKSYGRPRSERLKKSCGRRSATRPPAKNEEKIKRYKITTVTRQPSESEGRRDHSKDLEVECISGSGNDGFSEGELLSEQKTQSFSAFRR